LAVLQGTVVQHRQVKATAVPRNKLWRIPFYAVEKAPHQLGLIRIPIAKAPDLE